MPRFGDRFADACDSCEKRSSPGDPLRWSGCLDQNRDICGPFGQKLAVEASYSSDWGFRRSWAQGCCDITVVNV